MQAKKTPAATLETEERVLAEVGWLRVPFGFALTEENSVGEWADPRICG